MLKVLEIASNEVGYLEKASNKNLDDKTANAGTANYTKYARDMDAIPNFYNGRKQSFAWCDVFIDWCFVQAYGVDMGKRLLCQPDKSLGAGCKYSANYYKKYGQFYERNPKVGDQIFFGNSENVAHTGIVYKVDSDRVYTIEGNTSGASGVIANGGGVCKKSYSLGYSKIFGYGRPNYALVDESSSAGEDKQEGKVTETKMPTIKKGSKGKAVYVWQAILGFTGSDLDGDFGPNTDKKTREFQTLHKLEVDGIVGPISWRTGLESV